jgi:hypothetical protein
LQDLQAIENEIQYNLQKKNKTPSVSNAPAMKALEGPRLFAEQQQLRQENLEKLKLDLDRTMRQTFTPSSRPKNLWTCINQMQKKVSDIASQAGKEYFKKQVVDIGAAVRSHAAQAASGAKAAEMEQTMKEKV